MFAVLGTAVSGGSKGLLKDVGELPILRVSREKMPNVADNIQTAIDNGIPSMLNRTEIKAEKMASRRDALRGQQALNTSQSLSEYPFAFYQQGGKGAQVKPVPRSEQNIQGGELSNSYRKYKTWRPI